MTVQRKLEDIYASIEPVDDRNVHADLQRLAIYMLDNIMVEDELGCALRVLGIDTRVELTGQPQEDDARIVEEALTSRRVRCERYAQQLLDNVGDFARWAFDAANQYRTILLVSQDGFV